MSREASFGSMAVMSVMFEARRSETGHDVRLAARAGFNGLTVGRAPGRVQANVFVIPERFADDFEAFCRSNPLACPLLARGEPGNPALPELGVDIDIRTDLPSYLLHRQQGTSPVQDVMPHWHEGMVAFAIGCWFGAEQALADAGIRMRHRELGVQGALYQTALRTVPAGAFGGPLVVSMRPFARGDVARVRAITSQLPRSHGAPMDESDPAVLGIGNLANPDWGAPLHPQQDEISLFWPCGLTALAALNGINIPFFVTQAPGSMLVTDLLEVSVQ